MHRFTAPSRPHVEIASGVVSGVAIAVTTLVVDSALGLPPAVPTGNARGLLAATFGALVTAGAFSFWMLPLAAQLAAASVPSPTVAAHLRDPFQRRVIATTLGALAYTAVAGLALPAAPEAHAPTLTTLVAAVLGGGAIAALLVAIQHAVRATTPSTLVSATADAVVGHIDRLDAECREQLARDVPPPALAGDRCEIEVRASRTGWLEHVDPTALLDEVPSGSTVSLEAATGASWPRAASRSSGQRGQVLHPAVVLVQALDLPSGRRPHEAQLVVAAREEDAIHAGELHGRGEHGGSEHPEQCPQSPSSHAHA